MLSQYSVGAATNLDKELKFRYVRIEALPRLQHFKFIIHMKQHAMGCNQA